MQQRVRNVPGAKEVFDSNGGVKFVYDHVKYHDRAAPYLDTLGWHQRVATPPWSPDFNRPVERAFGTLKRAYKQSELPLTSPDLMQALKDRVNQLAGQIKTASVRQDVETLPLLWRVIAGNTTQQFEGPTGKKYPGVEGGWPHSDLR